MTKIVYEVIRHDGGWAFKLMAKVPGENETVQGTVVFKAK